MAKRFAVLAMVEERREEHVQMSSSVEPRDDKRRQESREPITIRVDCRSAAFWRYSDSLDLSRSGIFLQAGHPAPAGTQVRMEWPIDDNSLIVRGKVVWVRQEEEEEVEGEFLPPGMGIEFTDVTPEVESQLEEFMRNYQREHD